MGVSIDSCYLKLLLFHPQSKPTFDSSHEAVDPAVCCPGQWFQDITCLNPHKGEEIVVPFEAECHFQPQCKTSNLEADPCAHLQLSLSSPACVEGGIDLELKY